MGSWDILPILVHFASSDTGENKMATTYTVDENARNHRNAKLFIAMLKEAFKGHEICTMSSHHICFMLDNDFSTIDEIPSADTLMFDHTIMTRIFGYYAHQIMIHLASLPTKERDRFLEQEFNHLLSTRASLSKPHDRNALDNDCEYCSVVRA
jgi:hypothetical protein